MIRRKILLYILMVVLSVSLLLGGCTAAQNAQSGPDQASDTTAGDQSAADTESPGSDALGVVDAISTSGDTAAPSADLTTQSDITAPDTTTTSPSTHSPIHIVFSTRFSEQVGSLDQFVTEKENLRWLLAKSEAFGADQQPKITLLIGGPPAMLFLGKRFDPITETEKLASAAADGIGVLKGMLQSHHELGSSIGPSVYANNSWTTVAEIPLAAFPCSNPTQIADPPVETWLAAWDAHMYWIDTLITQVNDGNTVAPGTVSSDFPLDAKLRYLTLTGAMSSGNLQLSHGYAAESWPFNQCFVTLFGHGIWNPWQPYTDAPLVDSAKNTSYVTVPHYRVLGPTRNEEKQYVDGTLAAHQREFIQLLLERQYQQSVGVESRVWVFGTGLQLSGLSELREPQKGVRDVLVSFVDWLNTHFVDATYVENKSVARYATVAETRTAFTQWRSQNPAHPSFSYDLQFANYKADDALYPYKLRKLRDYMINAHFSEWVENLPGGVRGASFEVCPSTRNPLTYKDCYWRVSQPPVSAAQCFDSNLPTNADPGSGTLCPTRKFYVFWAKTATTLPLDSYGIDASEVIDAVNGVKQTDTKTISVGPLPMLVIPAL